MQITDDMSQVSKSSEDQIKECLSRVDRSAPNYWSKVFDEGVKMCKAGEMDNFTLQMGLFDIVKTMQQPTVFARLVNIS